MQSYLIRRGRGPEGLERQSRPRAPLGPKDVRVSMRAVALNYRDLMVARAEYGNAGEPRIPCSDGAGEVLEAGAEVTRLRVGDRVAGSFYPLWIDGEPTSDKVARGLGGGLDGVLAEEVVLHEDAWFAIPTHLNFVEAATIPCAGVTAWNALFVAGRLKPGDSVLILGTGGVSIWALQIAKAAGLRAIVTSSDDRKLERARALGAHATINYRTKPEWHGEVLQLTRGCGVDLVLEVGGRDTLARSIAATRVGGTIAMIGGIGAGGFGGELEPFALISRAQRLIGILVGSRAMAEDLSRFAATTRLHPVVDRVFDFDQAREAYACLAAAQHIGKVAIEIKPRPEERTLGRVIYRRAAVGP
jgi:NADPH:quinone reductase-like Zn-dependent oxidoreductase